MNNFIPTLRGFVSRDGKIIRIWCPFCNRWHSHGWGADDAAHRNGTHRVAHCHDEKSPFSHTGYFVKQVTKADMKKLEIT